MYVVAPLISPLIMMVAVTIYILYQEQSSTFIYFQYSRQYMHKKSKSILIIVSITIAVILISLGIYSWLYIDSLNKVELQDFTVTGFEGLSFSGVTLKGNIQVYNGGRFPVDIENITYKVVLNDTNDLLSEGYILGEKIEGKSKANFPISVSISWPTTAKTMLGMLTSKHMYVKVTGSVYVKYLFFMKSEVKYEQEMDLKSYLPKEVVDSPLLKNPIAAAILS
jgi:LEA14-like dessication related protein